MQAPDLPEPGLLTLEDALVRDLRSDHAGECGAVGIYRGVLAVSRDPAVRRFSLRHIRTELRHRRFFDRWLPRRYHSRLLPLWRASGWILGALPALFGARAVYTTVAAVERFVEAHYLAQIDALSERPDLAPLRARLQSFCDEEVEHRQDASLRLHGTGGVFSRFWGNVVGLISSSGVYVARRI